MEKQRQMSERSLENLKLGAIARDQGKIRTNCTLLPETLEWLKKHGNASHLIDELVKAAKSGELKPVNSHENTSENEVVKLQGAMVQSLQADVERLERERIELENQRSHYQGCFNELTQQKVDWYGCLKEKGQLEREVERLKVEREKSFDLLRNAIVTKKEGGSYDPRNGTSLRDIVKQVLKLLEPTS
jgi:tellurite resistance protein